MEKQCETKSSMSSHTIKKAFKNDLCILYKPKNFCATAKNLIQIWDQSILFFCGCPSALIGYVSWVLGMLCRVPSIEYVSCGGAKDLFDFSSLCLKYLVVLCGAFNVVGL